MIVRDLFNLGKEFNDSKLIAGEKGLGRKITEVDIMEIPDGVYWSQKGKFSITTGYYYRDNPEELENVIKILNEKEAAGIGIKIGRFINEIPANVIKTADELNFPILSISINVGYSDIIWAITSKMLGDKTYDNYIISKYREELMLQKGKKYNIDNLLRLIYRYINKKICLIDNEGYELLNSFPDSDDYGILKDVLKKNEVENGELFYKTSYKNKKMLIINLEYANKVIGYVCIVYDKDEESTAVDIKVIQETIPYFIIYLLVYKKNKLSYIQSADEYFIQLLQKNFANDELRIREEAKLVNLDYKMNRIVCVIESDSYARKYDEKNILEIIKRLFENKVKNCYCIRMSEKIVIIFTPTKNHEKKYLSDIISDIIAKLNQKFCKSEFKIGVSKNCSSLKYLYFAYEEAVFALKMGKRFNIEKKVYFYDDYMVYHILNKICEHPALTKVYRNTIGRIKESEYRDPEELVNTLKVLSKCDFNVTEASKQLFIHRNTLYKRIGKIQEVLNMDLENSDSKFILQLVTKIDDMIK